MRVFFLLCLISLNFASAEPDEDTPVLFTDLEISKLKNGVLWTAPDYANQQGRLGYDKDTFATPKGMEARVAFWLDIYTNFSTDQGVLHDSLYVDLVYEKVDFSDIMQDLTLNLRQKEKARRKRVDTVKKEIRERLNRLGSLSSPEGLTGDDLRYWQLFAKVDEPNKFKKASEKGRLRFQLGQRDRFIEGIYQSGRYLAQMEEIFRQENLPIELTRLPFVESSFNLKARSKIGASGIWQFIRSAARPYMKMNDVVDERNDPLRATRAAAKKLKNNYEMLQTWPLAVTGYNHGPSGVRRLVQKYKTKDLEDLLHIRKGRFGFASANFYASFLAALEAERNAPKYYGPLTRMPEIKGQEIKLTKPMKIAELLEKFPGGQDEALLYNPHILPRAWKRKDLIPSKTFIRLPPAPESPKIQPSVATQTKEKEPSP